MKGKSLRLIDAWLESKRAIMVVCRHCGRETPAVRFTCVSCGGSTKSWWALGLSIVLVGSTTVLHALFLWKVLPSLAALCVRFGMTFPLSIRLGVVTSNLIVDFGWSVAPLFFAMMVYLGFLWRPEKPWGSNAVLTASIAYAVAVLYLFLVAHIFSVRELLPRLVSR